MHDEALVKMDELFNRPFNGSDGNNVKVLDVGSFYINGSLRTLAERRNWQYTGLDVREGKNVDIISPSLYDFGLPPRSYHVVCCANMLHNCPHPWMLVPEMARVLKHGGLLAICSIWLWPRNRHPVDYHRWTDDGLRVLLEGGGLTDIEVGFDLIGNSWGSGLKP